jgi:hypothetical protein
MLRPLADAQGSLVHGYMNAVFTPGGSVQRICSQHCAQVC